MTGFLAGLKEVASNIPSDEACLSEFLEILYRQRGWDFRNYKKSSLRRRIAVRLNACKISSYDDYCEILKSDPDEYNRLFSTMSVKVSEFFREPMVFEPLKRS